MEPNTPVDRSLSLRCGNSEIEVRDVAGLRFAHVSLQEASLITRTQARDGDSTCNVFTVNVDLLVQSFRSATFRQVLAQADLLLADGMPIVWLSRLLQQQLPERVAGSDLVEAVCEEADSSVKLFLLGAGPGIAEKAAANIAARFHATVAGVYCPSRQEVLDDSLSAKIVDLINDSSANMLLVGLGAPLQETWILKHSPKLNTRVNLGIGATIDFLADNIPRAPKWMRKMGLEWFYRLLQEPGRLWRRYLVQDTYFLWIVLRLLVLRMGVQRNGSETTPKR